MFAKIMVGTSMRFSPGDPPGVLFKIGSPVDSPSRYFVPFVEADGQPGLVFQFGEIEIRLGKVVKGLQKLSEEAKADQVPVDQFERRLTELIVALLKVPFENNPELANVEGRRSVPDSELEPEEEADEKRIRRLRPKSRRPDEGTAAADAGAPAGAEGSAETGAPEAKGDAAGRPAKSSGFGAFLNAAKSAYRKTVASGPEAKAADSKEAPEPSEGEKAEQEEEPTSDEDGSGAEDTQPDEPGG
jgi:hypothetical protein